MANTKLCNSYANAFLSSLSSKNLLSDLLIGDAIILKEIFKNEDIIESIIVLNQSEDKLHKTISQALNNSISYEYIPYIQLILSKKHASHLSDIMHYTEIALKDYYNISDAIIYSGQELKKDDIEFINSYMTNKFHSKFNFINKIDSSLISGIKIQYKDHIIDISLLGFLKELKSMHESFVEKQ